MPSRKRVQEFMALAKRSKYVEAIQEESGSVASNTTAQCRHYRRHWTPVHLDFAVDDVHAATELAVRAGAMQEGEIQTHVWGHIAHMADPFGHGFCLIQFRGRGYDEIARPAVPLAGGKRA